MCSSAMRTVPRPNRPLSHVPYESGLGKVEVCEVEGGAPFVLASSPHFDKKLPTVLLVADYGVDDPSVRSPSVSL